MKPYYLITFILGTFMLWYISESRVPTVEIETGTSGTRAINGELNQVTSTLFSPQGKKLYLLKSDKLHYSGDRNEASSGRLHLVYTTSNDTRVILTSTSGKILNDGDIIELGGEVIIHHFSSDKKEIYESVNTQDLIINVATEKAQTDAHTVIKQNNQTLKGDGLEVDLYQGKMKLLRNVKVQNAT